MPHAFTKCFYFNALSACTRACTCVHTAIWGRRAAHAAFLGPSPTRATISAMIRFSSKSFGV